MYCTEADLIARGWGEEVAGLSDKTGEMGGDVNEAILNQAIADASAKIDSYLVGLIAIPIATPSPYVVRCACDMTRFYLYDIGVIPNVRLAYEEAIAFFEQVHLHKSSLLALLGVPPLDAPPAVGLQVPKLSAPAQVFTNDLLDRM
jgi:phage gp36-like protein